MVTVNKTEYLDEQGLQELWNKIKQYVAEHGGSGGDIDLSDYATIEYVTQAIDNIPDVDLTPYETKTELATTLLDYALVTHNHDTSYSTLNHNHTISDITDYTPTDLTNYYTKTETYNKTEVDTAIANASTGGGGTGTDGQDGFSPIATVTPTDTGATISITDVNGTTTASITNGTNGIDGTNGADGLPGVKGDKGDKGDTGEQGINGTNGTDGSDGFSPIVTSSKTGKVTTVNIQDATHTEVITINDGEDGSGGSGGSGVVYSTTEQCVGTWIDNKPLYQKTIVFTGTYGSGASSLNHGISGFDTLFINGAVSYAVGYDNKIYPLPASHPNAVLNIAFYLNTIGALFINPGSAFTTSECINKIVATMMYTKA